jgi:hypothetical protein
MCIYMDIWIHIYLSTGIQMPEYMHSFSYLHICTLFYIYIIEYTHIYSYDPGSPCGGRHTGGGGAAGVKCLRLRYSSVQILISVSYVYV